MPAPAKRYRSGRRSEVRAAPDWVRRAATRTRTRTIHAPSPAPPWPRTRRDGARVNRLSGRRVVVTGGARDIGAAIVRGFVSEGATVAVLDPRVEEAMQLADEVGGRAYRVDLFDVTDPRERLEERRVGKECSSRWWPNHLK